MFRFVLSGCCATSGQMCVREGEAALLTPSSLPLSLLDHETQQYPPAQQGLIVQHSSDPDSQTQAKYSDKTENSV